MNQVLMKLWRLALREGSGMRCTKGSTANTVMIERVILTEFDSSNHTYKSICVIKETAAAMRENSPEISVVRKGGLLGRMQGGRLQCHMIHIQERLAP